MTAACHMSGIPCPAAVTRRGAVFDIPVIAANFGALVSRRRAMSADAPRRTDSVSLGSCRMAALPRCACHGTSPGRQTRLANRIAMALSDKHHGLHVHALTLCGRLALLLRRWSASGRRPK